MNRRGFLAALGLTGAGLAVPELWIPKRTFFLPPRGGWAARPSTTTITATGGEAPWNYQWTWLRGGGGITIDAPTEPATTFTPHCRDWPSSAVAASGAAICTVTDSLGRQHTTGVVDVEFGRASLSPVQVRL